MKTENWRWWVLAHVVVAAVQVLVRVCAEIRELGRRLGIIEDMIWML